MQYIIPCHDCVSALGNKEQPVPWDSITPIFALSGEAAGFFVRPRRQEKVSLSARNSTCELLLSSCLQVPAITLMSYILTYFMMYFTTVVLINYFIWPV